MSDFLSMDACFQQYGFKYWTKTQRNISIICNCANEFVKSMWLVKGGIKLIYAME